MRTIYPSKKFLADVRRALNAHERLEVSVEGGWRGKILAKEVGVWLPFDEVDLVKKGPWKAPSAWCGLLMMSLNATHFMALSANYEMRSMVSGDSVVLTYLPL